MENDKYISLADCYINIDNSDKPPTHFILSTKKIHTQKPFQRAGGFRISST